MYCVLPDCINLQWDFCAGSLARWALHGWNFLPSSSTHSSIVLQVERMSESECMGKGSGPTEMDRRHWGFRMWRPHLRRVLKKQTKGIQGVWFCNYYGGNRNFADVMYESLHFSNAHALLFSHCLSLLYQVLLRRAKVELRQSGGARSKKANDFRTSRSRLEVSWTKSFLDQSPESDFMQISDADADRKERAGIILGLEYSKKVSILMLRLS